LAFGYPLAAVLTRFLTIRMPKIIRQRIVVVQNRLQE
jgi:hypothetical protein